MQRKSNSSCLQDCQIKVCFIDLMLWVFEDVDDVQHFDMCVVELEAVVNVTDPYFPPCEDQIK